MIQNPRFLQLLVSRGVVSEEAAQRLAQKYNDDDFGVLLHLVRSNPPQKNAFGRVWGDALGISYVDLSVSLFQPEIVHRLPESFALKHHIVLLYQFGAAITAALANPNDQHLIREAEALAGAPISPVFSYPEDIEDAIEIEYKSEDQLKSLSSKIVTETILIEDISELTRDELQKVAGAQAVVEFAQGLLLLAVREGASDIHIEPQEDKVSVRFRIDGALQQKSNLEKSLLSPLVSRLKILADLDITEKRKPQDGRINLKLPNRSIDFRFSSIPTIYGEKIVLRMLGQPKMRDIPDFSELNFSKNNYVAVKEMIDRPHGILFVTGPTGSGKTTTLFSILKRLHTPGVNIVTIEDPVEYRLPGCNQVQVNPAIDLDFATALRSFLRQDPDIILVGEIRDLETAEIACRAALTGHLVFATLHTNTAVQAIARLVDIGVQPYVVAPSIVGVMAQRLVRRICDNCRQRYSPSTEELKRFLIWEGREVFFYRGAGCDQCNGTGYSGRIAIHEVVTVNDEIRGLLARGAPVSDIQQCARRAGFQTMRYDGVKKALRGLTTIEEVHRVTVADEEAVEPS